MLKNSKSIYFIKGLFDFIDEGKKLEIIKYNKEMQTMMNINLINYKFYSKSYIVINENGKIKEFNKFNDQLEFEGEYLNGKRNGKGKEYYDFGYLGYEGEYLNGKRNGKGKLYYENGVVKFEGEYINGKIWNGNGYDKNSNMVFSIKDGKGSIKIFNNENILIREGEYLNGELNGKGKEYDCFGKIKFEGEYINWYRNGQGKEYNYGKLIFEGEYLHGAKWNGKGYNPKNDIEYILNNGKGYVKIYNNIEGLLEFEGELFNGLKNGKGNEYNLFNSKLIFEGEYKNGIKNGKGKEYYFNDKLRFEGEYLYGQKRKGKEYINDRLEFEGEYLNNEKWTGKGYDENNNIIYELINGTGKVKLYRYDTKLEYEGEILKGKKNGKGKEYEYGYLDYEGEYLNGKRNGKGKEYFTDGRIKFEGEYLNGKRHGKGKEYSLDNGKILFKGEYLNGERQLKSCNIL